MKSPNTAIETYFYNQIGATFTANSETFEYYPNPPGDDGSIERYAWLGIDVLSEDGSKDTFMTECLAEITIVDRAGGGKFSDNTTVDAASTYILQQLVSKGREVTQGDFKFIVIELSGQENTLEFQGQQSVKVRKLLLRILAEEL